MWRLQYLHQRKKDVYPGEVMTKGKQLATCCECMSGGDKFDKKQNKSSACIHALPRGFMLTDLLTENLFG